MHRTATLGIVLIGTLVAFSFWTGVAFGAISLLNPPETERATIGGLSQITEGDYVTTGRMMVAVVAGAVLTALTWAVERLVARDLFGIRSYSAEKPHKHRLGRAGMVDGFDQTILRPCASYEGSSVVKNETTPRFGRVFFQDDLVAMGR